MTCWRKDFLKQTEEFHCQEMAAFEAQLEEENGISCFCLGVINLDHRDSPEHNKRFCLVDNTQDGLDIAVDLTDVDVAAIQATLSSGMLAAYQRARTIGGNR